MQEWSRIMRLFRINLVRSFLFLVAMSLSYILMMMIYNVPGRYAWPLTTAAVNWKMYGDKIIIKDVRTRRSAHPPLDDGLSNFQIHLLSGLPLQCNQGDRGRGILAKKYDRFLQTLDDYVAYHRLLKRSASSTRTLVWQCASHEYCGGLGDRIKGVTYSLLLAMFSRRRLVVHWEREPYLEPHMLDWRDSKLDKLLEEQNSNNDGNSLPESFPDILMFGFHVVLKGSNISNDISESDMNYYQRMIGSKTTNVVISTNLEPSSLLDSHRNGGDPKWVRDGLRWCGLLHLSHSDLDDMVGLVFRYLFRIKDVVFEEVKAVQSILGLSPVFPYLGLHIRSGFAGMDHVELIRHPKLMQSNEEWDAALKCGVATADRLLGNNSIVFLATDSNLVKQMAESKFGKRIRSLHNSLIHLDKLSKSDHSMSDEEREGVMVMWVEVILLAQAGVQVRGESGYSKLAGLLCGIEGTGSNTL